MNIKIESFINRRIYIDNGKTMIITNDNFLFPFITRGSHMLVVKQMLTES